MCYWCITTIWLSTEMSFADLGLLATVLPIRQYAPRYLVWKGFCEVVQCVSCLVLLDGTVRRRCRYSMTTCPAWDQTITLMMSSLDRSQERFLSFINTFDRLFLWWVAALKLLHVCASIRPLSSVDHCLIRESIQFVSSSCCLLTFFTCICFDLCALKLKEYFS